jgi:hypothetical protein
VDVTSYKYGTALLPARYNICGVELKPFCLGHLILLEQINNPLVASTPLNVETQEGLFHLFEAILICALSFEDATEFLTNDDEYKNLVDKFNKNLIKNMDADSSWNFFTRIQSFKEYLSFHMEMPIYTEEREGGDNIPSGTDWKQNIFVIFKKLGYGESEILNMNLRKLFYQWCSYAEAEGAIKVMNKVDLDGLARLKKEKQKHGNI